MPEDTADRDRVSEFIEAKEAMAKYWQAVPGEQVAIQRVSLLESQVMDLKTRISRMKPLEKQVEDLESKVERKAAALVKQEEFCQKEVAKRESMRENLAQLREELKQLRQQLPQQGRETPVKEATPFSMDAIKNAILASVSGSQEREMLLHKLGLSPEVREEDMVCAHGS